MFVLFFADEDFPYLKESISFLLERKLQNRDKQLKFQEIQEYLTMVETYKTYEKKYSEVSNSKKYYKDLLNKRVLNIRQKEDQVD